MVLRAVRNLTLPDQVFQQLAGEILSGQYEVHTNLPAERKLVEMFGVNRHVVREALKRLEQVGLVKVSQGGGTRVLDARRTGGLDVLAVMAEHANFGPGSMGHWLAVHEMRLVIAADAARLCALRGSQEIKDELVQLSARMRETADALELMRLELKFWDKATLGADNIAYRLAFNSLTRTATAPGIVNVAQLSVAQEIKQTGYREQIAARIAAGDGDGAEAAVRVAMKGLMDLLSVFVRGPQSVVPTAEVSVASSASCASSKD